MIKAIFFDFDGVLTLNQSAMDNTCLFIHKKTKIPFEKVKSCYKKYDPLLDIGKILHKDMWNHFCQCIGQHVNMAILLEAFKRTAPNKPMFDLALRLRNNGYKTGIISDSGSERFYTLVKKFRLKDIFDLWSLACEVGSTKTKEGIFEKALNPLNLSPEESFFIDNKEKNLIIPKKMGFHTYFYDDEKNDMASLIKWLKGLVVNI